MMKDRVDEIDQLLPQTQCGLCGYAGCHPYATALAMGTETINKCLPGGIKTLQSLGALLAVDPTPFLSEMQQSSKRNTVVNIREDECIGCTKCIQVCPVDAIIGASKKMHTVLATECSGCELCIPACPVDCMDVITLADDSETLRQAKASVYRQRYQMRKERDTQQKLEQKLKYQHAKQINTRKEQVVAARKAAIEAAIERVKTKSIKHEC